METYLKLVQVLVKSDTPLMLNDFTVANFVIEMVQNCVFLLFTCFLLVHGQVTIIFVVSVCLFVCLFVCADFFSAVVDPISIKLGHM